MDEGSGFPPNKRRKKHTMKLRADDTVITLSKLMVCLVMPQVINLKACPLTIDEGVLQKMTHFISGFECI